jgi:polyferredoxin
MASVTPYAEPPGKPPFDVLRLPLIGRVLRWRYGRLVLQIPFLIVALLLVYDGFTGPQRPAENMATVLPWVHYRGFVVLALLLAGNLFCMGCPFTVPRTLARRLSIRGRRFPRVLRNKWLAILALFGIFFAYEWFDLWASPALTAWVIVAYFVASFVLEAVFTESAFCKYVCPLGTFNFTYSTLAPTRISVLNPDICRTCVGKECVNGSYSPQPVIRLDSIPTAAAPVEVRHGPQGTLGCGTELFAPQIRSNMDCTLCLDCVRACPHQNATLATRPFGRELIEIENAPRRWDIAYLYVALTAMAVVNAFGMVPPVYDLMQQMADALGLTALGWSDDALEFVTLTLIFVAGSLLLPAVILLGCQWLSRKLTGTLKRYSARQVAGAFSTAFVPVGMGIWIAHYGFHFLTGLTSLVPVIQTFLIDHRIYLLGTRPDWSLAVAPSPELIGVLQVIALGGGFLWSLSIANNAASRLYRRSAPIGLLPWALALFALILAAVWIFSQPMEMRGTILFD